MNTNRKAMFLYIGTGSGFKTPAIAIAKEFIKEGWTINTFEMFESVNHRFAHYITPKIWQLWLNFPFLFEINFFLYSKKWYRNMIFNIGYYIQFKSRIKKRLFSDKPEFIFITDFVSLPLYTKFIHKYNLPIKIFYYNSDVVFSHDLFINNTVNQSYVSSKIGYDEMISAGQKPNLLTLAPFPIDEKFKNNFGSQKEMRLNLGLQDKFTILVTFGGEGIGPYNYVLDILKANLNIQIVLVCAKNQKIKNEFDKYTSQYPLLHVLGYTTNLEEYLFCSDISAGKSGLNVVFEAIYMKKPFMVWQAMFNEQNAANFIVKSGIGIQVKNGTEVVNFLSNYISNPETKEKMISNIEKLNINFNTHEIVKDVQGRL